MRQPFPERVTAISQAEFWSSLSAPEAGTPAEPLRQAIARGLAGAREEAYATLADYHRESLAAEWTRIREEQLSRPMPEPDVLRDVLNHKITAWHTEVVQFGAKIDWTPSSVSGDCVHGLNRLRWLQPIVTAYIHTGEARYRDCLADMLSQYHDMRFHPRWDDLLQFTSLGSLGISAAWPVVLSSYLAFLHDGALTTELSEKLLNVILGYGRALDCQLDAFNRGNNSFAVGNLALLHIARVFPEFAESAQWDEKAVGFIMQQAEEGYYADGGNLERVWGYGLMHLSGLAEAYAVARRTGGLGDHEETVLATIREVCRWYAKTVTPSPKCFFPTYGDAGWEGHNCLASVRATVKDVPGCDDPFFGVDRTKSYLLEPSGFAVMRNGDHPEASYVNINFGEFGGWHSHWDLLNLNFWAQGEALLEEQCRFGPYANPLDTLFRAPESHNLTLIDGMVYDNRPVRGEDVAWQSDDVADYFSAYHRAYRYHVYGHDDPVRVSPNIEGIVRRTVLLVKDPGYVVVMDSVRNANHASFNRAISQYWHAPFPFEVVGPGRVRTTGQAACLLAYARTQGLHRLETGVDFAGEEIAHLGKGIDRYSLRARRWMPLEYRGIPGFTTVIYPFSGKMPEIAITPLPTAGGADWVTEALEITTPAGTDVIALNPERLPDFAVNGRPVAGRGYVTLGNGRGEVLIP